MTLERPSARPTRRTVLGTIGTGVVGLAAGASTAGAAVLDAGPGTADPLATIERPTATARCWFHNGADRSLDVYVNGHDEAYFTVKPEEDGPVFSIDSDASGIYGAYTFEIRRKDDPDGPVLAAASAHFEEGDSYTAGIHRVGETDYRLSIYRNHFEPSDDSRLVLRHIAFPETFDWQLFPKPEADPRIPDDERSGTLSRGQWQEARDVTPNDYRLEILVDGEVVAFRQDLELEAERQITCYVVGDPKPWMGSDQKEGHILRDEFQIQVGEDQADVVTPPAEPYSTTDDNEPIQFDVEPVELFETNGAEVPIAVTDPDGIVNDVAVAAVEPASDGFTVPDSSVRRPLGVGGTTTATLDVRPKVTAETYDVTLLANPASLGERVRATVPVEVKPVTVDRLRDLVAGYRDDGDLADEYATDLRGFLDDADAHLDAGETTEACAALKRVIDLVGEHKAQGVSEAAAVDLTAETRALRSDLGCG